MTDNKRILVVDDDKAFVESTRDLLEAHGYEVDVAYDGAAGLAKARENRPDAMILDVMMATESEGFDVARQIPQSPELQGLPVLLVTGIRSAMKLGYKFEPDQTWLPVDRIMEKPIEPARFIAVIGDLLEENSAK